MDENNQEIGPVSLENLKIFRISGVIHDHTLVRLENEETWVACVDVLGSMETTETPNGVRRPAIRMNQFFFMPLVIKFIGEGSLFRRIMSSALRVIAVLVTLGAIVFWLQLWRVVFRMEGAAVLGGVLFQIFFLIGIYMIVHVLLIRATTVENLGKSEFTIIPIVGILLKMAGEILACFFISTGFATGISLLFGGAMETVNPFLVTRGSLQIGESNFVIGTLSIVSGFVGAVFWLLAFYLLSEIISMLVVIVRDLRAIREIAENGNKK